MVDQCCSCAQSITLQDLLKKSSFGFRCSSSWWQHICFNEYPVALSFKCWSGKNVWTWEWYIPLSDQVWWRVWGGSAHVQHCTLHTNSADSTRQVPVGISSVFRVTKLIWPSSCVTDQTEYDDFYSQWRDFIIEFMVVALHWPLNNNSWPDMKQTSSRSEHGSHVETVIWVVDEMFNRGRVNKADRLDI